MILNFSPSEVGYICSAVQDKIFDLSPSSELYADYMILLNFLCDSVANHFQNDDLYFAWLDEYDIGLPF